MKKLVIIMLAMCLSFALYAADEAGSCDHKNKKIETLVGSKGGSGFYVAPVLKFTRISGVDGVLAGGKLGWIFNGSFSIGLAGYGWSNSYGYRDLWDGYPSDEFEMGYGGLYLEQIVGNHKLLHFTFGVLLGGGGVRNYPGYRYYEIDGCSGNRWWDMDAFLICEPEMNLELNVARFMRIGAGVSYRFTTGLRDGGMRTSELNGVAGMLTLKFGKF
ncbi:MAG: hypothetical protein GY765_07605 [bacterium]|nr:hypothetical protein [bacterium]